MRCEWGTCLLHDGAACLGLVILLSPLASWPSAAAGSRSMTSGHASNLRGGCLFIYILYVLPPMIMPLARLLSVRNPPPCQLPWSRP